MTDYQEELKHLDTISLPDLRNNLGDTISRVSDTDDPIIITKNGKPIAAVVSLDDSRTRRVGERPLLQRARDS